MWSTKILESYGVGLMVLAPIFIIGLLWLLAYFFGHLLPAARLRPKSSLPPPAHVELPASTKLALIQLVNDDTRASLGLCKRALEEVGYDVQKAITLLQVTGSAKAGKSLSNGRVTAAVYGGTVAVILEVSCETAFTAQRPEFGMFLVDLTRQIAECDPKLIGRDYVGPSLDPLSSIPPPPPAPDNSILLNQVSVVPDHRGKTVQQVLNELSDRLGEQVVIRRFSRYELGA